MQQMEIILHGRPYTKKNSNRIIYIKGKPRIVPSDNYKKYEKDCIRQITGVHRKKIDYPINLKVLYYMPTRHRVDLVNLLEATCDILVRANVLEDDNCNIIKSHDGCQVLYDKKNPRAEIFIDKLE